MLKNKFALFLCFILFGCFLTDANAVQMETRHHTLVSQPDKAGKHKKITLAITTKKHVRNNNLAGIKCSVSGARWNGQVGVAKGRYVIFRHPSDSVRATAVIIQAYHEKHGINTISGLVNRYCAAGDKKAYVRFLCQRTGLTPNKKVNLMKYLHRLLPAIVEFESGEVIHVKYV